MRVLSFAQDQSLSEDSDDPGEGADARRDDTLFVQRQAVVPLHGLFDLRQLYRDAGNRPR